MIKIDMGLFRRSTNRRCPECNSNMETTVLGGLGPLKCPECGYRHSDSY